MEYDHRLGPDVPQQVARYHLDNVRSLLQGDRYGEDAQDVYSPKLADDFSRKKLYNLLCHHAWPPNGKMGGREPFGPGNGTV